MNGFKVLPLAPNTKVPLRGSGGFKEATTDLEQIESWFRENPDANYGIATGEYRDGYFAVVDVDVKKGKNGFDSIQAVGIELPATYTVATANGGSTTTTAQALCLGPESTCWKASTSRATMDTLSGRGR